MAGKHTVHKIKKNDEVKVITGKDRGKSGRVLKIDHENDRVVVEGVNMVKKAVKKRKQNDRGGIIEVEAAMHISNVMIICKKCGPTRIGYRFDESGKKLRLCRKCGELL
jgi:large subunit ribosomal protein L24